MSRRALLRAGAIGGTGLVLAYTVGCGDDDDAETSPTATATRPAATSPQATASPAATEEAKEFALVSGWYRDQAVEYYDFGMNSTTSGNAVSAVPIYVLITGMNTDGTPQFVEGQHNIVDLVPGDAGYSDLWQVVMVTVPQDYVADTLKSKSDIDASGYPLTTTEMLVNCPIVPEGSTLEGGESLVQGWYKGDAAFYPDFGANPSTALPIWAFITGMDAQGNPQFVEGQGNIIDSVPSDQGYSAFWRVNMVTVPADYEANTIKSAEAVLDSGFEIAETDLVVNCPVTVF